MPRPVRKEIPISESELTIVVCDDGSRTLRCNRRDVTWHSESGALSESKLVFLQNSGIADLLGDSSTVSRVLEIGFGTGLNFWLTASLAMRNSAALDYVSYEPNPLPGEIASALQYDQLESCQPAMSAFPNLQTGKTVVDQVSIELHNQIIEKADLANGSFDAVYHDAFSPEDAPELWSKTLFEKLFASLKPAGKLVTYCVKSEIQRRLASVGFEVSKTKGPRGGKREVLIATRGPS